MEGSNLWSLLAKPDRYRDKCPCHNRIYIIHVIIDHCVICSITHLIIWWSRWKANVGVIYWCTPVGSCRPSLPATCPWQHRASLSTSSCRCPQKKPHWAPLVELEMTFSSLYLWVLFHFCPQGIAVCLEQRYPSSWPKESFYCHWLSLTVCDITIPYHGSLPGNKRRGLKLKTCYSLAKANQNDL